MMIEHPKTFNKFKSLSASKKKNNKSKYRQPQRHPGEGSYPSGGPKEAPRMYSEREWLRLAHSTQRANIATRKRPCH